MNRRHFLASCGAAGGLPLALAAAGAALQTMPSPTGPARVRAEILRLDLQHTWTIARGSAAFKENVLVYYERDGLAGMGEAGHLTAAGQTAAQTLEGIERLKPLYAQADPFAFAALPALARAVPGAGAPARAAMELALMDWVGRKLDLPLHKLFGLDPRRAPATSFTIGLDTPEAMRQKVREAAAYPILKVKLGAADDEQIIQTLRAETDKPLRVDANEGWKDRETAARKIEWLARQNVELVEQPLPRRMIDETAWLRARSSLPIIADEAAETAADLPRLAGAYTGVNIKLMKAGGVLEALRMFHAAQALGLDTMLGCMIESSLAVTAAAQLQSLARWVDLDGCLLLKRDPFEGAVLAEGRWQLPRRPGLGARPRT